MVQDGSDLPAVNSSASAGSSRAKKGGAGPRKATPQRKQNNRKAQQRYREKRKMQAVEREEQVRTLGSEGTWCLCTCIIPPHCHLPGIGHACGIGHVTQCCAASATSVIFACDSNSLLLS